MDRNRAKATLLQVLSEILTEGIEDGPTETYSKADIDRAAKGLAYLVVEGVDDPWTPGPGPWSEDDTVLDPACDTDQMGLFLDIGDTRYTLGDQGLIVVDGATYTVIPKEHLSKLSDMLDNGNALGII